MGRTDAPLDACPLLRQTKLIFAFIHQHQEAFPVELMCEVLEVSLSGYYAWRRRPECNRVQKDRVLTAKIITYHQRSRETYGTPRIKEDLAEEGLMVSRQRIGRLMKAAKLQVRCKRKFRTTTKSKHTHPVAENVLDRDFKANGPNQKWVTDITYLPTTESWLYLATVMDLYSRRIVGWSLNERLHTPLVIDALNMARQRRNPGAGLLHHSTGGVNTPATRTGKPWSAWQPCRA
nr:IS3 family transposase [Deinococcus peraridilitoris]